MIFPFEILSTSSRELGLVVAILIGFGFGFVLERAGFGRADKLAAQFYFRDMTVFKVMFTAIVTAMLGLVIASGVGLVNLRAASEQIVSFTYLWPMLAGGLLLGVGFIVSAYCPGTSIVAAASGNVDGAVTVAGVVTGTFIYNELLLIPAFKQFHNSGNKGSWFLYDLLGIPPAVLAGIIAVAAIAAFVGAEKVERIFAAKRPVIEIPLPKRSKRQRKYAFATISALVVLSLATLTIPSGATAATPKIEQITPSTLARQLVESPWNLRILDLRPAADFAKTSIPASENVEAKALPDLGLQYLPPSKTLVVVNDGKRDVPPEITAYKGRTLLLAGGIDGWKNYALATPAPPPANAAKPEVDEYLFRVALNQSLTGARASAPAVARPTAAVPRPQKKGGGCSS